MKAIISNNYSEVKRLIDTGDFYKTKDDNSMTPLMHASKFTSLNKNIDIVILLLAKGSTDNTDNKTKLSELNEYDIKIELLKNKVTAGINEINNNGLTALMIASMFNNLEIVRLLLYKGADVNIVDNQKFTALIFSLLGPKILREKNSIL